MKIKIQNQSGNSLTVKGRTPLTVRAFETREVELPDTPRTRALLARLAREYPAMRITRIMPVALPKAMPVPSSNEEETENGTPPEEAPAAEPMEKDAFAAAATVTEKGSGWREVSVAEVLGSPFKVRAKDTESAIEMAYEEYLEAATAPAQGE